MDSKRQETVRRTDRKLPAECKTLAVYKVGPVSTKVVLPCIHSLPGFCIRALCSEGEVN